MLIGRARAARGNPFAQCEIASGGAFICATTAAALYRHASESSSYLNVRRRFVIEFVECNRCG